MSFRSLTRHPTLDLQAGRLELCVSQSGRQLGNVRTKKIFEMVKKTLRKILSAITDWRGNANFSVPFLLAVFVGCSKFEPLIEPSNATTSFSRSCLLVLFICLPVAFVTDKLIMC